jgi:hypothetical protein
LLLGAADRAIGLIDRFAACFHDEQCPELVEHEVATLVGQRVFGIALGYEDLNDHDDLRHDPLMAVLAGKLTARRQECAPVAGKSTLNRLELSQLQPTRYHKISHNPVAIRSLFLDVFLEAHKRPPREIILDLDATDDPVGSLVLLDEMWRPASALREEDDRRGQCSRGGDGLSRPVVGRGRRWWRRTCACGNSCWFCDDGNCGLGSTILRPTGHARWAHRAG